MYNGELGASASVRKTDISPMHNGELGASVYKQDRYLADVQPRARCVCT